MARTRVRERTRNFAQVMNRDGEVCQYCLYPAEAVDHVVPQSYCLDNSMDNLVAACGRCNRHASNLMFNSFEEKKDYILSKRRPEMLKDYKDWNEELD